MTYTNGNLRIWWMGQVPMDPFYVDVKHIEEAIIILDTLAKYDSYQFENNMKPDYCNAGGLEIFEDNEWFEWDDEDGNNIDEYLGKQYT
jgi:hypothetical protein